MGKTKKVVILPLVSKTAEKKHTQLLILKSTIKLNFTLFIIDYFGEKIEHFPSQIVGKKAMP